jgi:hypothetical protein
LVQTFTSEYTRQPTGFPPEKPASRETAAVRVKRVELGLPNRETRPWTAEEIALLGTAADAEIAERIGRSRSAVSAQRWQLGIPPV